MEKNVQYYTPVGAVKFPMTVYQNKESGFIYRPTEYKDGDELKVKFQLVVDKDEAKELLETLDSLHEPIKNANFKPYKDDYQKNDDGELVPTGKIAINFTSGFPVYMVDADKNDCNDIKIGWGSKIKVQFVTKPVNNKGKVGLGRYVKAIQVIELKDAGVDVSGFDKEEGFKKQKEQEVSWEE